MEAAVSVVLRDAAGGVEASACGDFPWCGGETGAAGAAVSVAVPGVAADAGAGGGCRGGGWGVHR